jgi:NAD-dependent SIR2 family protein deacetylase
MDLINKKIKMYRKTKDLYYEIKNNVDKEEMNSIQYFYKYKEYFLKDDYLTNY